MIARRPALLLVSLLLVVAGLAGCGDDGGDGEDDAGGSTTTRPADDDATEDDSETTDSTDSTDTTGDDDGSTTEAPADDETTTTGTTNPDQAPADGPLADLLLDPATVGPTFAPDDSLGDGTLDTDLCEEVSLEESWEDQAAQALLSGTGDDAAAFQQAILRFADEAAAEAFAAELGDALVTCQPGTETSTVQGVGDGALLATVTDEGSTAVAGIVWVGDLVAWHLGFTGPGATPPVDEAILSASADRLAG